MNYKNVLFFSLTQEIMFAIFNISFLPFKHKKKKKKKRKENRNKVLTKLEIYEK